MGNETLTAFENNTIRSFDARRGLKIVDVEKSTEALGNNKSLMSLNCTSIPTGPVVWALSRNTSVKLVSLDCGSISVPNFSNFIGALSTNKSVKTFRIGDCQLKSRHFAVLASLFATNKTITNFTLQEYTLDETSASHLCAGIAENSTLTKLDLLVRQVPNCFVPALSKILTSNSVLKRLSLSIDRLADEGAKSLAECLTINQSITELMLSTLMGDQGAVYIAGALKVNSTLECLNLAGTGIKENGGLYIAEALLVNVTLRNLILSRNELGTQGFTQIFKSLESNTTIISLSIDCPQEEIPQIETTLKVNSTLKDLILSGRISTENIAQLVRGLSGNTSIRELTANISEKDAESLEKVFDTNCILTHLMFYSIHYAAPVIRRLKEKCDRNYKNMLTWNPSLFQILLMTHFKSTPNKRQSI